MGWRYMALCTVRCAWQVWGIPIMRQRCTTINIAGSQADQAHPPTHSGDATCGVSAAVMSSMELEVWLWDAECLC
jgi:hypothetical protein